MIERFAPGLGGVENVAWHVAHELANQGEDVTVITRVSSLDLEPQPAKSKKATPAVPRPDGSLPSVLHVPAPDAWQPLRVLLFSSRSAALLRRHPFDVVHGFARTRQQDLYRAGGGSHADYLRRNHSGLALAARQLSPRHRALLSIENSVFRDPHQRIQCASRLVADCLVDDHRVDEERILLLPNAVASEPYMSPNAVRDGARLRRQLDAEAERVWLLPGSGWHRKGLATLLEATALLGDPELRVWVAGRDRIGPWKARARALGVESRVRFLGERKDLPAVYQAADGMVLPTRYDPFANVTLEAAAAGLPIVTTAANGAAEWLAGDLEVVERAEDPHTLAAALDGYRDASRRKKAGERLRTRALEMNWPDHVARLRKEYRGILERRAGRARVSP